MKIVYADPPYLGCGKYYPEHPNAKDFDIPEAHGELMARMDREYDGWALSCSSPSLRLLLPMAPLYARVAAWVKPFAAFKRNVRIAYTWEPVIFKPARDSSKLGALVGRDHLNESITLKKGLTGAKPLRFAEWILVLLGYVEGDEYIDLFPGTGVMTSVLSTRLAEEPWRTVMREKLGQAAVDEADAATPPPVADGCDCGRHVDENGDQIHYSNCPLFPKPVAGDPPTCPTCGFQTAMELQWVCERCGHRVAADAPVAGDVRERVAQEIEFWLVDGNDTYIPAKPDDDTYVLADRILALLRPEPPAGTEGPTDVGRAMRDVLSERKRQDTKWGEQNHDPFHYLTILMEEVGELAQAALHKRHGGHASGHLREEAVHTTAVALAIIECLDRGNWSWGNHALLATAPRDESKEGGR